MHDVGSGGWWFKECLIMIEVDFGKVLGKIMVIKECQIMIILLTGKVIRDDYGYISNIEGDLPIDA
jgi:hypothetical protein